MLFSGTHWIALSHERNGQECLLSLCCATLWQTGAQFPETWNVQLPLPEFRRLGKKTKAGLAEQEGCGFSFRHYWLH